VSMPFSRGATENRYRLGIDLGSGSIGWAAVVDADGPSPQILGMGVRRFEAGVTGSADEIEAGKDKSRATVRRDARGPRRQTWRRQYRIRKVFHLLQRLGLLPDSDDDSHDTRNRVIADLDRQLRAEYLTGADHPAQQVLPYRLRAAALDEQVSRFALGRALYHLAQRRGFLSNRKAGKKDEDAGAVKAGIRGLSDEIERNGCRTLGEYFASLDPDQQKIRGRWTARQMYLDEFEKIWAAQSQHYDDLNDETHDLLFEAIFHQRKLKSQKGLIGACELEPGKRRAPAASLEYQEFRLLQRVNDLVMIDPANRKFSLIEREDLQTLRDAPQKRAALIAALQEAESLSFAKISRILGLKAEKHGRASVKWTFNFEEGGEKRMRGNTTAAKLVGVLGDRWTRFSEEEKPRLVDEILSFETEEVLVRRLIRGWAIPENEAKQAADIHFEQGYGALSRKAIRTILPYLERGIPYATARRQAYGEDATVGTPEDSLPANRNCKLLRDVRNPAVERALSELRLVVNALIRKYGKPESIRVELTRELKHSRDRRKRITERNRKNEKFRSDARAKILEEMGHERYCSVYNILKVRLAEECNWECPYTGRSIAMAQLVGDHPQFEVEHIVPFSRCFDNSFANKTLCHHEENRKKGNRTPFEAYGHTESWAAILTRVGRFRSERSLVSRKLDLFKREKLDDTEEFTSRQLTDTAYMSRLAAEYLGLLYGGRTDPEGTMRVRVSPGRVTSYLRREWDLNKILGISDEKQRGDHRHHAIDALVVALTGANEIQALSRAAEKAEAQQQHRLFVAVDQPWEGFLGDVFTAVETINVSSRVSRKLNGQLHDATILSPPKPAISKDGKPVKVHHVRKKLELLTKTMVDDIVDDRVRELVKEKLDAFGGDPRKAFQDSANHPYFRSKDGRVIPIHKVRIRTGLRGIQIGKGSRARYVAPRANHHMEIVARLDARGNEKAWEGHIVSRLEATRRHREGLPIVLRDHGDGKTFKFSLAMGEHVIMEHEEEIPQLYRVESISEKVLEFRLHVDARPSTVLRKMSKARITRSPRALLSAKARKVTVDPLGNILPAND
jgi:CRISPR-associated endonuclease Csn1